MEEEEKPVCGSACWYRGLSFWSILKCVYVCVFASKSNFCLHKLKYYRYIFPDRADCNFGFIFCKAKDETQMKDGYSKQAIDSCDRPSLQRMLFV